jgi:transcriptional regulator GlxA family with amidase domain
LIYPLSRRQEIGLTDGRLDRQSFRMPYQQIKNRPIHSMVRGERSSGGIGIVPDFTFDDAPQPAIVVVPAQPGCSPKMLEWIRKTTTQSDVGMSVCTGAYVLGDAGVLKGNDRNEESN